MRSDDVVLVPLDAGIIRTRLCADDFELQRPVSGSPRRLHFGPEFPGDALAMYDRLLREAGDGGVVARTYVVVRGSEVVGQVGTLGEPVDGAVEVGYGINASARGRGVATRALGTLLELLDVARVRICTAVDNLASGRVAENNGFAVVDRFDGPEGTLLVWSRTLRARAEGSFQCQIRAEGSVQLAQDGSESGHTTGPARIAGRRSNHSA